MIPELPLVNLDYIYISFNDNKKSDFEYYFNQTKNFWIFNNKSNIRENVAFIQLQIQNIINKLQTNRNFYKIKFFILVTNHSFNDFSFVLLTEEKIMYCENTKYGKYEYNS